MERISGTKIDFLVKTQQNTRTDNRAMINIWLGCKRGRHYQKPAGFSASLAGDLKGNKACSVSRQSCHLDCLHITNPEVSRDCCSRKALPHRHLAGHCFKKSLCWTSWLPRLLTPTRDGNEQVAWENRKARAEPRNLVLGLKLPTETEQIILFPNNFILSVEDLLLKDAIFKEEFCRE